MTPLRFVLGLLWLAGASAWMLPPPCMNLSKQLNGVDINAYVLATFDGSDEDQLMNTIEEASNIAKFELIAILTFGLEAVVKRQIQRLIPRDW